MFIIKCYLLLTVGLLCHQQIGSILIWTPESQPWTNLMLDSRRNILYAAGQGTLKMFDLNLTVKKEASTDAGDYNKVLLVGGSEGRLVVCGTTAPSCTIRDPNTLEVLKNSSNFKVFNSERDRMSTAVLASQSKNIMFVGNSFNDSFVKKQVVYFNPLGYHGISAVSLEDDKTFDFLSYVNGSDRLLPKFFSSMPLIIIPTFQDVVYVDSFVVQGFAYFFKINRTQSGGKEILQTVIARVCENDKNYFNSYFEMPLTCNNLTLVTSVTSFATNSTLPPETNIASNENIFVASFYNSTSGISSLCLFTTSKISLEFSRYKNICPRTELFYLPVSPPCKSNILQIPTDFCGGEVNSPRTARNTDGTNFDADVFRNVPFKISSMLGYGAEDASILVMGSEDGSVVKMDLSFPNHDLKNLGNRISGAAVKNLAGNGQYLFWRSSDHIYRTELADCAASQSCDACVSPSNQLCGWCTFEKRCTRRMDCANHDLEKRWIPSYGNTSDCPNLMDDIEIEVTMGNTLTIEPENLPPLRKSENYECAFSAGKLTSPAVVGASRGVSCAIPASILSSESASYETTFLLRLSGSDVSLFQEKLFVYACNRIKTCHECSSRKFCGFDYAKYSCLVGSSGKICPSIKSYSTKVHSNNSLGLKFELENVQEFQPQGMNCRIPALNVTLAVETTVGFACQPYKFITSKDVDHLTVYVTFGSNNLLNGSIDVEVYSCKVMGKDDCSLCKNKALSHNCTWCATECSFQTCPNGGVDTNCPYPTIEEIGPLIGPKEGGTMLTLVGRNLGSSEDQVVVKVNGNVCASRSGSYEPSRKFVCKVPPSSRDSTSSASSISLEINGVAVNNSIANFGYKEVTVGDINPIFGPLAGGTKVTLTGTNLLMSPQTYVSVKDSYNVSLEVIRYESGPSKIVFLTPQHSVAGMVPISNLQIDGFVTDSLTLNFTYRDNPTIDKSHAAAIFKSSGCGLSLKGSNLNISSSSYLVYGDCKTGTNTTIQIVPGTNRMDVLLPDPNCSELPITLHMDNWSDSLVVKVLDDPTFRIQNQENYYLVAIRENESDYFFKEQDDSILLVSKVYKDLSGRIELKNKDGPCTSVKAPGPNIVCSYDRDPGDEVQVILCSQAYKLSLQKRSDFPGWQTGLGVSVGVLVILVVVSAALLIKYFESKKKYDRLMNDINSMEQEVRAQMKEAFAKLQTTEGEAVDVVREAEVPFHSYRDFAHRILYPRERDNYVLNTRKRLTNYERKNQYLTQLLNSKYFFTIFAKVLDKQKDINEKSKIGSYLGLFLLDKMDYGAEVITALLSDRIDSCSSSEKNLKLMMRSGDTVVERLMCCWLSLTMYRHLRGSLGLSLYELFMAIKKQIHKGPVDACTNEAKFTLSEGFFLKSYKFNDDDNIVVTLNDHINLPTTCKLLSCDAISQAREKIHEAFYRGVVISDRIPVEKFHLVWQRDQNDPVKLLEEDGNIDPGTELVKIRTVGSYGITSGSVLRLERGSSENDESQAQILGEEILALSVGSPSLYPVTVKMPQRRYHLVKKEGKGEGSVREKIFFTEMYYPLLQTKVALEENIDKLFREILDVKNLPPSVKYLFDFIDDSIREKGISDPDIARVWKRDSFMFRVWVNLIQNPYFLLDIPKNSVVDVNLSVIGQALVDSCSSQEIKLTKDSPTSTLLFAKNHKEYRPLVQNFFDTIQRQPRMSVKQFMKTLEGTYSRDIDFNVDFNLEIVLSELYEFTRRFKEEIMIALDEDESSKNLRLVQKFQFLLNVE